MRKNRFLGLNTEINGILNGIIIICEGNDVDAYCAEKFDLIDVLEEMMALCESRILNFFENENQKLIKSNNNHSELADVKLPCFFLIFLVVLLRSG